MKNTLMMSDNLYLYIGSSVFFTTMINCYFDGDDGRKGSNNYS